MGHEECEVCGKRVYLMERLAVENHVFHRACFKCHSCSTRLKPGSYEFDRNSDRFYCGTHYRDLLRQQTVKRTMERRNLTSPTGGEGEGEAAILAPKRKKDVTSTHTPSADNREPGNRAAVPRAIVRSAGKDTGSGATGSKVAEATPTNATLATPTDISRQDSAKIRSGLPSMLKSLATAKQDNSSGENSGEKLSTQSGTGQRANIRDDPESSRTVLNSRTEKLPRQVDSKPITVTTKDTPTATPPVTFVSIANGKVGSSTALPEQPSSGKQLPGKLLSGKQVAIDRVVSGSSKVDKKKLQLEPERREGGQGARDKETEREGERKRREPDAKMRESLEDERRLREGGEKGDKATTSREGSVPVKPPRRRTKKALATGPSNRSEISPDKVHAARGPLAVFNCYLLLLLALLIHCVLYAVYRLYVAVSDV